jgi:hypothetical protein
MKLTRHLKITVTRRRAVRLSIIPLRSFCPVCAHEVEMLSASQAAALLEIDLAGFNSLLAAGRLHAIATASGGLCICKDSLVERMNPDDQGTNILHY